MNGPGPRVEIALALPVRDRRVLVALRPEQARQGGLWEFPGGKIDSGESPSDAARRELAEETGLQARELEPLALVVHDYEDLPVRLHAYLARDPRGRPAPARQWQWMTLDELGRIEMPAANASILRALRWRLA